MFRLSLGTSSRLLINTSEAKACHPHLAWITWHEVEIDETEYGMSPAHIVILVLQVGGQEGHIILVCVHSCNDLIGDSSISRTWGHTRLSN